MFFTHYWSSSTGTIIIVAVYIAVTSVLVAPVHEGDLNYCILDAHRVRLELYCITVTFLKLYYISVQSSVPEGVQNELSSMSDLLGNLTDSTFKQISEREDILENVNFGDVFSQLQDVLKSPEKSVPDQEALANHQSKDQSDASCSFLELNTPPPPPPQQN